MKPKVSIIMPIYNMERYLARCLDSLVNQTLPELEIVAVDDGSTDRSRLILQEYAERDSRIHVVGQPNAGVSAARNKGMEAARGSYIGFVDPDDWADPDMFRILYETAVRESADIVMCGYIREFGSHAKVKPFPQPDRQVLCGSEVQEQMLRRMIGPLEEEAANPEWLDAWGTVWNKLFDAGLIREHRLVFTDLREIGTNEDSLFNIRASSVAGKFVFLNRPLYHYWRANDASVTTRYKPELQQQWRNLYRIISGIIEERGLDVRYRKALDNRISLSALGLGLNTVSKSNPAGLPAKLRKLREILNDEAYRRSLAKFNPKTGSLAWKMFFAVARIRFAFGFYCLLIAIEQLRRMSR